ncbi:MAG: hypothetical protein U5L01_07520 [Rheinheimera sp.]|nr:hypothetical protein [Rheinheimera sp.]
MFMNMPETDFTFQINFPTGGFSGMVTKPWDERDRTTSEILPEVQQRLSEIAGVRILPITPPSFAPGGGPFPVEFVIASTANSQEIYEYALKLQDIFTKRWFVCFPTDVRCQSRSTRISFRYRPGKSC